MKNLKTLTIIFLTLLLNLKNSNATNLIVTPNNSVTIDTTLYITDTISFSNDRFSSPGILRITINNIEIFSTPMSNPILDNPTDTLKYIINQNQNIFGSNIAIFIYGAIPWTPRGVIITGISAELPPPPQPTNTAVEELKPIESFLTFFQNSIKVKESGTIQIFNTSAQMVLNIQTNSNEEIDLTNFTNGIYIVTFSTKNKKKTLAKKIYIQ